MILLNPAHGVKNTWLNSNKEEQTRIISQAWKTKGKREFIGREGKLRRWRWSLQHHRMTNLTACNKGALVHRRKKRRRPSHDLPIFQTQTESFKTIKAFPGSSYFSVSVQIHRGYIKQMQWRGEMLLEVQGWGGRGWTSLNRLHSGGWSTSIRLIPMQPAASLPQTAGREEQRGRKRGQQQNRGGCRGKDRKRERKLGPKASKVAKGEKWRSNAVNASTRALNKASYGPASYSVNLRILAPKEWRQLF